ncbi:uncharacterized protein FTJAE_6210 [Fusarium tjaetaba]|uniref:Uncharacterized protein n=1 Tax=Fusarium tjaetaba TaxID=1567544 RepID=A0A8H5RLD2_9HYPO|nr:uncharacterized protein FTJAE_6210 [Fusarium tjaetaba]KAF5635589.1 hypothetical protein FTJAE_6210 [Fusarium tjaetaba]
MLLPKLSLLAVMGIPVAALKYQNEVADATIDRNWLLSGCGPCRKYPLPNNDADGFRYDEDNDATYKSICDVCRSNYGPRQPGRDDYDLKQPDKDTTSPTTVLSLPKETPTITSSRTTQTKPHVGWLTPPGPDDGATFGSNDPQQPGRDDDGSKQPENGITSSIAALKHPKETLSITSIKITQTKPRVGWSTLPGPDDGTTLAWFTKTTTHTETETTTTTASTTIDLNPEETDTPTSPKKNRSAGLQTAGIVMAVLFFILFTGLITWKCFRHRQQIQFYEGPEGPMGEAGGSAFDDSGSEADGRQARNLVASVRDWFRRHQFPFPPPNEPEDPTSDGDEPGPRPVPPPPPPPPPIPEQPVQAPVSVVHSNIPPTRPAIPRRQVRAPSIQVPTPDPAQDRSSSSVYSQDSGYPRSIEIPRPLSIHRSRRTQEEPQSPREWRTTGEPVPTEHYGWV